MEYVTARNHSHKAKSGVNASSNYQIQDNHTRSQFINKVIAKVRNGRLKGVFLNHVYM